MVHFWGEGEDTRKCSSLFFFFPTMCEYVRSVYVYRGWVEYCECAYRGTARIVSTSGDKEEPRKVEERASVTCYLGSPYFSPAIYYT